MSFTLKKKKKKKTKIDSRKKQSIKIRGLKIPIVRWIPPSFSAAAADS